jgi:hypothetical protein
VSVHKTKMQNSLKKFLGLLIKYLRWSLKYVLSILNFQKELNYKKCYKKSFFRSFENMYPGAYPHNNTFSRLMPYSQKLDSALVKLRTNTLAFLPGLVKTIKITSVGCNHNTIFILSYERVQIG